MAEIAMKVITSDVHKKIVFVWDSAMISLFGHSSPFSPVTENKAATRLYIMTVDYQV